jgi:hypothetical protein
VIETLIPIQIPPGIFRNGTKMDASGRWYDGNLMRWVEGYPQPVGGWDRVQYTSGALVGQDVSVLGSGSSGAARGSIAFRGSDGTFRFAYGLMDQVGMINPAESDFIELLAPAVTLGSALAVPDDVFGSLDVAEADSWSFDVFGSSLVFVGTADGRLWVWAGTSGFTATVAANAPTSNKAVVVTPERFVVLLGAGGNQRKVQWADQESTTVWTPTSLNQAGDFEIQTKGRIMCGARTKAETLIWTDTDLHTMNFIGGSLVYSFAQAGDNCGIISRLAKVTVDTQAFWMGRNNFFRYDGFVQPIRCDVHDYVFEDFNKTQASQVWAMTIAEFSEVWWFYCSAASSTIDRYVIYNYRDNHWSIGEMARTTGADSGVLEQPMMIGVDRLLYYHETDEARTDGTAYLESGPITLDKDRTMRIQRIVPDGSALGDAQMSLYTSMFPLESETLNGPYSLANPTDVRLSAKHIRVKITEADDVSWRVGVPQLGVIPQGRR